MATPTPTIPTFTDGTVVHATDLNALASNLTNLYNYNQASFTSQRPVVIAKQTTGQIITTTDTTVNFQTASVNTDNMWTASVPTQITVQHAGIYYVWCTVTWPLLATGTFNDHGLSYICVNAASATNAITSSGNLFAQGGGNSAAGCSAVVNLAAGATIFLLGNAQHTGGVTLTTTVGGTTLGAMYMTSAT